MLYWTIWEFRSPSTGETVRAARPYNSTDRAHAHEYQRILWQGAANGEMDAWFKSGVAK